MHIYVNENYIKRLIFRVENNGSNIGHFALFSKYKLILLFSFFKFFKFIFIKLTNINSYYKIKVSDNKKGRDIPN